MLAPSHFQHDEIVALDRAYINYEKFEELTESNVVYVTKMKKSLKYEVLSLLQSSLERRWSFSGLATMVHIVLMEYLNMNNFFNMPDADMKLMLEAAAESPPNSEEYE